MQSLSANSQLETLAKRYIWWGSPTLQLVHRESVDFDFFSAKPLDRNKRAYVSTAEINRWAIDAYDP